MNLNQQIDTESPSGPAEIPIQSGAQCTHPDGPVYTRPWAVGQNPAIAAEIQALDVEKDCQRIAFLLAAYEFPFDITRSLEVALYHTYGSRSVARLLDRTGEFKNRGQKRYDDTNILIAQFIEAGWDMEVGHRALTQMNHIHGHFDIPNDDFLFVLWTFIDFPIEWMKRFGWRPMSSHEQQAWFNFWVRIGQLMGIEDIPVNKASFDRFVDDYEKSEMLPNQASKNVASATVAIMESWFPRLLRPLVRPVAACLLRPRFLVAAGYSAPSPLVKGVVIAVLKFRARLKRYVSFERYPNLLASQHKRTYPMGDWLLENVGPEYAHRRRPAESD